MENEEGITITTVIVAKASVDLSDQIGTYSNTHKNTIKLFRKLVLERLLTTSMVNALILYIVHGDNMPVTDFRKAVVNHLVTVNETSTEQRKTMSITS